MGRASVRDIGAKLDELAEIKAAADVTRLDFETKRAEILKSVQAELNALEAEYAPSLEAVTERIGILEAEIKDAVLSRGASVKGSSLQAVYYRGRVTWNTKGLNNYSETHPEIVEYRRQGNPSVTLRVLKTANKSATKS